MIGTALSAVLLLMAAPGDAAATTGEPDAAATAASALEARGEAILQLLRTHYVQPSDVAKAKG